MQQRKLQGDDGERIGGHQQGHQRLHLGGAGAGQVLDQRRLHLGVDQIHQQVGEDEQHEGAIPPHHPEHGPQGETGIRPAGAVAAKAEQEGDAEQTIAGGRHYEGLLARTQPHHDADEGPHPRPHVEQEVAQVQSQLPQRLLGQQIPHQRLARGIDKGVGEARAKHPEGDEPEGVAEPEQQVGAARQGAAEQQYGAPAEPVGEPADVEADEAGEHGRATQQHPDTGG